MRNLLSSACLLAVTVSGVAHAASPLNSSIATAWRLATLFNNSAADCPTPKWCQSGSVCHPEEIHLAELKKLDHDECTDSCLYLADQCCTFCFTSSLGSAARAKCIGQCPITVKQELKSWMLSKAQNISAKQNTTVKESGAAPKLRKGHKSSIPPKTQTRPARAQGLKVPTPVQFHAHVKQQQLKEEDHGRKAIAKQVPTVVPPAPCGDCEIEVHTEECMKECKVMHETCTTNCLIIYEDPALRRPCLKHCESVVTVQLTASMMTPPPHFDILPATEATPFPGPPPTPPLPPTPRLSPQAIKAASALHAHGIPLPANPPFNAGPKLQHLSMIGRPTLSLSLL